MNASALILMVATQLTVMVVTAYFFFRVLRAPQRPEPDSYSGNDPQ